MNINENNENQKKCQQNNNCLTKIKSDPSIQNWKSKENTVYSDDMYNVYYMHMY